MTRFAYVMVTYFAGMAALVAVFLHPPTKLIWNVTKSAPVGLYWIGSADRLRLHELVAVTPPSPLSDFLVERGYTGRGVPLLKQVSGLPGQNICRSGRAITVDGLPLGEALDRDRNARDLPQWQGCHVILDDELFLMNTDIRDSLDGRYFGPIATNSVIGRAMPIWIDADPNTENAWSR